ncbi:hypothetical protein QTH87_02565 [Variovorax sp. J22P168]|uniref:hypothetical protein n=1 Tax=Variovorax jilinensis TaxID=3053513 RepID=UPI002578986E|nr:hypothetical protein [Variovorax sp. J22P168]MDM0011312.1 hypothetical protein [Variovorax sp. J22P168]
MRLRDSFSSLALGLALTASLPASATPLSIYNSMRETPITKFSKADMALMMKTIDGALDSGADGAKVDWANAAGSSSGSVTPAKDPKGRAQCRLAHVENRYKTLRGAGSYVFCRNAKAKSPAWELVEPWSGS